MNANSRATRVIAACISAVLGTAMIMLGLNVAPASAANTFPKVVLQCWQSADTDFSSPNSGVGFPQHAVDCDSLPVPSNFGFDRSSYVAQESCDGGKWQWDWYYLASEKDEAALNSLRANGLHWDSAAGMAEDAAAGLLDTRAGKHPQTGKVISMPNADVCQPDTKQKEESVCDLSKVDGIENPSSLEGKSGTVYYESTDGGKTWTITDYKLGDVKDCAPQPQTKFVDVCDLSTVEGIDNPGTLVGESGRVYYESTDGGKTWTFKSYELRDVKDCAVTEPLTDQLDACDLSKVDGIENPAALVGKSGTVFRESTDGGQTWHVTGYELKDVTGCTQPEPIVKTGSESWTNCDVSKIEGVPAEWVAPYAGKAGKVTKSWKQNYKVVNGNEVADGDIYDVTYTYEETSLDCSTDDTVPGSLQAECVSEVPWLQYSVDPGEVPAGSTLRVTFLHPTDPTQNYVIDNLPFAGKFLWPGASENPDNWPGFERTASGEYVETAGNFRWTRNGVQARFDVIEPGTSSLVSTVSARTEVSSAIVAKTFTSTVAYPQAGALCVGPAGRVLGTSVETVDTPERVLPSAVNSGEGAGSSSLTGLLLTGGGAALVLAAMLTMVGVGYRGKHLR